MSSGLIADAFEVAKEEFLLKFLNCSRYDFSKHSTIGDVYEATDQIQREQASKGTLRNFAMIKPFLDGLAKYEKAIETLVQVKPDVLALIWVSPTSDHYQSSLLKYEGTYSVHTSGTKLLD